MRMPHQNTGRNIKASPASNGAQVKLSWSKLSKKQKNKVTGIMVYRGTTKGNMTAIKRLSKNATSFTDLGCKSGTTYYYQIKTYKKIKKYYNTKTKKWQKKKPKKKYRGETATAYPTKHPSAVVYIRTKKAPHSSSTTPSSSATPGGKGEPGESGGSEATEPTGETKSITNYLGQTYVYEKLSSGKWKITDEYGTFYLTDSEVNNEINDPLRNHLIDGEFTVSGGTVMWQKNGVTFVKSQLSQPRTASVYNGTGISYEIDVYNGNPDLLSFEIQNPTITVTGYDYVNKSLISFEETYVTAEKDSRTYRLVKYYGSDKTTSGSKTVFKAIFQDLNGDGHACGLVGGQVSVKIKYDGEYVGAFSFEPNKNANSNGLSPKRQEWLNVALEAIGSNGGKDYEADMIAIENFVTANYPYSQYDCIRGALILETYSIYAYDEYGFIANPPDSANQNHYAFFKDSDAANGIYKKWETQGYK